MPEVNLTRLQAFHFLLILLALPLQYFLVEWTSNANTSTQLKINSNYKTVGELVKSYLSLNSWKQYLKEILRSRLLYLKEKKLPNEDECIAKEVFRLRDPTGYFGSSLEPRLSRSSIKYRVGQVIRHKKYGYRGVIVGWDKECRAPQHWIDINHKAHPEYKHQPSYSVLVDSRDRLDVQTTYVAQDNIEVIGNAKIQHPQVDEYFDFYDGAQYHMRPALKKIYPKD